MSHFTLAIGLHNHQPVGNFEHVFEDAHQKAYHPFLELLERHPHMRMSIHQSGILWDWQEKYHPEYFKRIATLVKRGQVELMTGGFYEPILPSIPERDALGQIDMLSTYVEKKFGQTPEGLWLTERVWEPYLPKMLAKAGVKFLPVDDTHFLFAGLELSQLTGPFVTEHEGYSVVLLPIQKKLRYLIPFGQVEQVITELKRQADRRPDGVAVYADDGEKFGSWPNTYDHCYVDGWLERLFEAIDKNSDWLRVAPLKEAAAMKPAGRVYLPTASYEEMLHWALPPTAFVEYEQFEDLLKQHHAWDTYSRFVRGGFWRGFLAKYDESNLMQKKMLTVSDRAAAFEDAFPDRSGKIAHVKDRLYASQCNCPYWHGVFGGLYLPHIRKAVYACMIEADKELRQLEGKTGVQIWARDYDCDGTSELLAETDRLTAIIKPNRGGMLLDLSLNQYHFNPTDTLTRRQEGYHRKLARAVLSSEGQTASIHDLVLAKEEGLQKYLVEDWYLKRCAIDHFLGLESTVEEFRMATYREEGDFVLEPYEIISQDGQRIRLRRQGFVWRHQQGIPVLVDKEYAFSRDKDMIELRYEIRSAAREPLDVRFGVEHNFTFQAGHAEDRYVLIDGNRPADSYLDSIGAYNDVKGIALADDWLNLAVVVSADRPGQIWHCPIYTVSLSEGGFEKVYQGTTILHHYLMTLTEQPINLRFQIHAGIKDKVIRQAFSRSGARVTAG